MRAYATGKRNMEEKLQRIRDTIEGMGISLKDEKGNFLSILDLFYALSDKFEEEKKM